MTGNLCWGCREQIFSPVPSSPHTVMNHAVPTDSTSLSCKIRVRAAAVCILIIPPRPCHYSSREDRHGEHLKDGAHFPARGLPLIIAIVADCSWTRAGKNTQRGRSLQEMKTDETVFAQLWDVTILELPWAGDRWVVRGIKMTDALTTWLLPPHYCQSLEMGTVTEPRSLFASSPGQDFSAVT